MTQSEPFPSEEVEVRDVAFGGDGVARLPDGRAVFIPFTIEGERVSVRVIRHRKKSAEARLLKVLEPAPSRVEPPCPYFGRCGGCSYQHIDYPAQLKLKAKQVEQTLRRVGKFEEVPMQDAVPSPSLYAYRNRIRVHVQGGQAGFFAYRSHRIIDIDRCAIASEPVNVQLAQLRRNKGLIDGDYQLTATRDTRFFSQTNDGAAEAMLEVVRRLIPSSARLLIDAYCGAGFFARRLSERFERVIGIEQNESAIEEARRSATEKETYQSADVGEVLGTVLRNEDRESVLLLLDPPAAGLDLRIWDSILAQLPADILYISCNPGTLARDLHELKRAYVLEAVIPIDMFPQTAEIEVVTLLRRKADI